MSADTCNILYLLFLSIFVTSTIAFLHKSTVSRFLINLFWRNMQVCMHLVMNNLLFHVWLKTYDTPIPLGMILPYVLDLLCGGWRFAGFSQVLDSPFCNVLLPYGLLLYGFPEQYIINILYDITLYSFRSNKHHPWPENFCIYSLLYPLNQTVKFIRGFFYSRIVLVA